MSANANYLLGQHRINALLKLSEEQDQTENEYENDEMTDGEEDSAFLRSF
jgi:hypothetical protein